MSILRWWNEPLEDPFVARTLAPYYASEEPAMKMWRPTIDIKESADSYVVNAELPGVRKEDINVEYENGMLCLSGEKNYEKVDDGEQFRRVERSYGSFKRSINLGEVDANSIKATFKDGILQLRVPKLNKETDTKKIAIH